MNAMVIRPDKSVYRVWLAEWMLLGLAWLLFGTMDGRLALLLMALTLPLLLAGMVSQGRTLEIRRSGVTVSLWKLHKSYSWEELTRPKRFGCDYAIGGGRGDPYTAGVEFGVKKYRRPNWLAPGTYSVFVRPWGYFFLHFPPGTRSDGYPKVYEVSREYLEMRFSEMGIPIEPEKPHMWTYPSL